MSKPAGILNSRPVNLQAARLLWRAPWWARLDVEDKALCVQAIARWEEKRVVDYFKEPAGNLEDRRGCKVQFRNGETGIITGFQERVICIKKKRGQMQSWYYMGKLYRARGDATEDRRVRWWVLLSSGEFRIFDSRDTSRHRIVGYSRRPEKPINCANL